MIFTVGNHDNYLAFYRKHGTVTKTGKKDPGEVDRFPDGYPGGVALLTPRHAYELIIERNTIGKWGFYPMLADWDTDTYQLPGESFRRLLIDAEVLIMRGFSAKMVEAAYLKEHETRIDIERWTREYFRHL